MRSGLWMLAVALICLGCSPEIKPGSHNGFTDSEACKALLRDLKIPVNSELGKALVAEQFLRQPSGDCIIETSREQFLFNLGRMEFRIVRGIDAKTGAPHVIQGRLLRANSGRLEATFVSAPE